MMGRINFLQLTTICLTSSAVLAASSILAPSNNVPTDLLPRAANNCTAPGFQSCNHPNLPSSFCCPSGSDCILFNNALSVVCCPAGGDCKSIAPITCDLTQQNAALHPANQLHSTDLTGTLSACGSACCPKGFSCQNGQCIMAANAVTTSKSAASTAKASSKPTAKPSNTTSQEIATAHCDKFPALAIIAGFFPGLLLGILSTLLIITCLGHHRNKRRNSDLGSITAKVSDPIYQTNNTAFRTDFLRRDSRSQQRGSRARSFFSRTPPVRSPVEVGPSFKPPVTPVRTPIMRKEPSTESIKIYSPPNGGLGRPHTTFTDMMHDAGFRPGDPYFPGSPTAPPRR